MSVHSTKYENEEDYKSDLQWEYRTEDKYDRYDRMTCRDCGDWDECFKNYLETETPFCETGMNYLDQFEERRINNESNN